MIAPMKRKAAELELGGTFTAVSGITPRQFPDGFKRPWKMCSFFLEGRCQKDLLCTFAHCVEEMRQDAKAELWPELQPAVPVQTEQQIADAEEAIAQAEMQLLAEEHAQAPAEPAPREPAGPEEAAIPSVLLGAREFPQDQPPRQLCQFFLLHPTFCEEGDACPMAHGLVEMGVNFGDAVQIQSDGRTHTMVEPLGLETPAIEPAFAPSFKGKGGKCNKGNKGGCKGGMMALPSNDPYGRPPMATFTSAEAPPGLPPSRFAPGATGPSRVGGTFMPARICGFWLKDPNSCNWGTECSFAHGVHELQPSAVATCGITRFHHTGRKPTKVCSFFATNSCTRGLGCTFAHSPDEMALGSC